MGKRLRHFAHRIDTTVGEAHGERVRRWFEAKKAAWYAVIEDPQMPTMSTVLDQAHNAMDRKLFSMKGFHHPGGSQAAFLTGLAHLYNLIFTDKRETGLVPQKFSCLDSMIKKRIPMELIFFCPVCI
jgi:hypothetical protein